MSAITFSTDDFPKSEKLGSYREAFRRLVSLDIVPLAERSISAQFKSKQVGPLAIGKLSTSPADYLRTTSGLKDGADSFILSVCRYGEALSSVGDQLIGPRQAVFCDNARAQSLRCVKESAWWTIKIPRGSLGNNAAGIHRLAGRRLDERNPVLRLLFNYLEAIDPLNLSSQTALGTIGRHIMNLSSLAIDAQDEVTLAAGQSSIREARRASIIAMIDERFADPDFTASSAGREMGISARYVHLLMEETGRTFAERVLSTRLDTAFSYLLDPRWEIFRIADIALEVGFADLSTFNRSFRRHFGSTPSEVRKTPRRI